LLRLHFRQCMSQFAPPPDERVSRPALAGSWKRLAGRALAVLSASLCVVLTICYFARPDACAAITVVPPWAWLIPGLFLAAFSLRLRGRGDRVGWIVVAAWLVFLLGLTEEPSTLGRALLCLGPFGRHPQPPGEVLRVISLNCAIGNRLAAEEVVRYRPDLVLLQESPGRREVQELARRLFGAEAGVVYGVDASLVVRGRVVPVELPSTLRAYFVQARVTLPSGRDIEVIGTRLVPAVFRIDLWSPDCWREQAQNRRRRRGQLRVIAGRIEAASAPVIVGGDFNAPQGDAVFRVLRPKLHDAFAEGGVGWGNTILNGVPVLRIDQVWVSKSLRASRVVARGTRNSDHRMVICDLSLQADPARPNDR
jgi:vancomycin resistance protein VanJ